MSDKRILVLRQNLALRNCRTAVHLLLPLFQKIATSFFHKRRRAGILPLTPYKPQKSRMDGLSGKNFSGGSVFPDNKAFRKLRFARCLIENRIIPLPTYQYRHFPDLPKMDAKKAANLFRIYCFMCRCGTAGYSVFIVGQCVQLGLSVPTDFLIFFCNCSNDLARIAYRY